MTPTQAADISRRAHLQLARGRCSCHTTAQALADLADAYLDAEQRHAQIVAMIPGALMAWACNDRDKMREAYVEIEQLAKNSTVVPLQTAPKSVIMDTARTGEPRE